MRASFFAIALLLAGARVGGSAGCTVPPYALLQASADIPQSQIEAFQLMGRCYLACAERLQRQPDEVLSTIQVWPILNIRPACPRLAPVHECVRGCSLVGNYRGDGVPSTCSSDCHDACRAECGSNIRCDNADSLDPWLPVYTCRIRCQRSACDTGCSVAESFIRGIEQTPTNIMGGSGGIPLDPNSIPVAPSSRLNITTVAMSNQTGLYRLNLNEVVPDLSGYVLLPFNATFSPTGFLLRVENHHTEEISYIWQSDPWEVVKLTRHACQNISISLAVINKWGATNFTDPQQIVVPGDDRRIPNPPRALSTTLTEDTRVGYFAHFILNMTWLRPEDYRYVDAFTVIIKEKIHSASVMLNRTVMSSESGSNSITLMSEPNGLEFLMTRSYSIKISSVGADGESLLESTLSTSQVFESSISNFACRRIWDGHTYFSFEVNWTIPPHWASRDVIDSFRVRPSFETSGVIYGTFSVNPKDGQVDYTEIIESEADFFRPKPNAGNFRIQLSVAWTNEVASTPGFNIPFCFLNASSPPPTVVRNITLTSVQVHGANSIEAAVEWLPPLNANGNLVKYAICLTDTPLEQDQEVDHSVQSRCTEVQSTLTSLMHTWSIITGQSLYIHVRAKNSFVYGSWSEPILVDADPLITTTATTTTVATTSATTTSTTAAMSPTTQGTTEEVASNQVCLISGIAVPIALISALILCLIVVLVLFFCYKHRLRHGHGFKSNSKGKALNLWSEAYTAVPYSAPKKVEEKAVKMEEWKATDAATAATTTFSPTSLTSSSSSSKPAPEKKSSTCVDTAAAAEGNTSH